ncbi:hypothetical protein SEA_IBANTIK_43 [Streptomyces phage Ibantik]|uniref:Uncharacterized protein n=1 Tax=Streptomyces phage Ibantik TaxID=2182397 RepID=A0A2U8UNF9_9CAUD|nr:hypothetical protein QEH36_gp043 [Streptomyces phage Ibantik]AWN05267.1 hypothetical protein SEA_IBANTIK_43 [Streptomyces phage Ibantik]
MKKYMDPDGDIWAGPDDSTLLLRWKGGQYVGVGVSKSHIERQIGELTPVEDD